MQELTLLKLTSHLHDSGECTIRAITPVSTVELTAPTEEVALQVFTQLGKRLLETIESELIELKGDMES